METALRTRLKTAVPSAWVEWDERPQASQFPAIVLETISGGRDLHFKGFQTVQPDRIQISCFARTKAQAISLREAVIAEIIKPVSGSDVEFQGCSINFHRSDVEATQTGVIHSCLIDATIWHA